MPFHKCCAALFGMFRFFMLRQPNVAEFELVVVIPFLSEKSTSRPCSTTMTTGIHSARQEI